MTAALKHIGLGFLVIVIAMAMLQPDSNEPAQLSVTQDHCMMKTLAVDQPAKDLEPLVQPDSNPEPNTSEAAMSGNCQSMSSFILSTHELTLPSPAITGRTDDAYASQYTFLIDDRTSDPPRKHS